MTTQKFPTFTNHKTTGKKIEQKRNLPFHVFVHPHLISSQCLLTSAAVIQANREMNSWIFPGRIEVVGGRGGRGVRECGTFPLAALDKWEA